MGFRALWSLRLPSIPILLGSLVFINALSGCSVNVKSVVLNDQGLAARSAEAVVEIYTAIPPRSHILVGTIIAQKSGWFVSNDEILEAMKVKARQLGCDAIILTDSFKHSDMNTAISAKTIQGQVIHWK